VPSDFRRFPSYFFFSLLKLLASCISTDGDSPLGLGVQRLEFTEAESVPTNVILGERAMTIYNFAFFFSFSLAAMAFSISSCSLVIPNLDS
jgi:hypothetical protein